MPSSAGLLKRFLISAFFALTPVPAQTVGGSIGGEVTDAAGKPVSGATVTLLQEETNRKRTAASRTNGEFQFTLLTPGAYRLEVDAQDFRRHVQTMVLAVNQEIRVAVPLLPGKSTEQMNVTSTLTLLRTDSATVGGVIGSRQVQGLPLDGRNFYELSLLLPGVAPAAEGSAGSVRGDFAINVNGAREDATNFLLDGVFNSDPKLNGTGVTPPVDAIREFEVAAATYDASFGRNGGGQVNVVTRSGGNQFHGTAYEFFRNALLDARNYFAPSSEPAPQNQRNQFGASLGGPLKKNRTFFFADYEGRRVNSGVTQVTNVPTLAERAGDFSHSSLIPIDPFTQQPFANFQIPKSRLDPAGAAIAALYPAPNRSAAGQNFVSSPAARDRDDHFDLRVDHSLAPASQLSVRYSFSDRRLFEPFTGPGFPAVPGYGDNVPRRAQNAMIGETHVLTPALLNEFRAGFDRVSLGVFQQDFGLDRNAAVGLPEVSANTRDFGLSSISVTGFSPLGDEPNNPQHGTTNVYQLTDNLAWARGRHLAKFGVDARILQQNAFRDVESRGFIDFVGFTGNALAELLLGLPTDSGVAQLDNPQHLRTHSYNFFANDTWRVRPELTLTLGLRYEYNSPGVDAADRANLYDPARQTLLPAGTNGMPRGGYLPDRNNFAPRAGLAWMPRALPGTVLRAGYGVYYDQSSLAPGEGLYFSPPYFTFHVYYPLGPTAPLLIRDPFPASFPLPTPPSALAFQRDLRTSYIQQWNFNIEHTLGRSRMVELGYVGTKGTGLIGARDINQPQPTPAPFYMRPVPQFADINLLESSRNSVYHSLQARFEQRLDFGLTMLASYTWSKSIDDGSSFFSSAGDPNYPQNSYNLRAERGLSNFDVRNRLAVSYAYDLPFGKGRWRGGWQTFGILQFQTGRPFTAALLPRFDNSNTGISSLGFGANNRPNVAGDPRISDPTPARWFNTAAFVIPPRGTFGNAGRNVLTGPGLATVNLSLVKNAVIREGTTVQFRAETFNLFNRANFGLPDNFVGSPTFGQIASAGSPRRLQLGLKLLF